MATVPTTSTFSGPQPKRRLGRAWRLAIGGLFLLMLLAPIGLAAQTAMAVGSSSVLKPIGGTTTNQCGSGVNAVHTSINIGCYGASCKSKNTHGCSALLDATFAILRFLSAGVGIVVIGSVIWAGIQYTAARDDPSAVGKAKSRIVTSLSALGLFIFGYAILNYVVPAGFFK